MATSKEFADYILEQFDNVTSFKMMGEYCLYTSGKVFGGLYDNRLLVKITESSTRLLGDAEKEYPYDGGSLMYLVEDTDNRELLNSLAQEMYFDLPLPKKKKAKSK